MCIGYGHPVAFGGPPERDKAMPVQSRVTSCFNEPFWLPSAVTSMICLGPNTVRLVTIGVGTPFVVSIWLGTMNAKEAGVPWAAAVRMHWYADGDGAVVEGQPVQRSTLPQDSTWSVVDDPPLVAACVELEQLAATTRSGARTATTIDSRIVPSPRVSADTIGRADPAER
jgi:hypothetical protein